MKKWIVLALLPMNAFAGTAIQKANNQAGINIGYLPTQIRNVPIEQNSQYLKGHQLGLGMNITKLFYERVYVSAALNDTAGNLSFGKHTPRTTATSVVQNGGLRLGYLFMPREQLGLTPYATLGYQFWQLDEGGHYEGVFIKNGYTKIFQNGFWGIGLLTQASLNPRTVVSLDITVGKTINPWLRFDSPDTPNIFTGKTVIYQSAFMSSQPFYQIGAGIDYAVNDQVHAKAGVQYQHAKYSASTTTQSHLKQPRLDIAIWNYQAGLGFDLDQADTSKVYYNNQSDVIVNADNEASLWFGYTLQNYGETLPNTEYYFDREVGNIPTVNMMITKTFQHLYTQFNLESAGGNTAYKSSNGTSNTSGSPPTNTYTRNALLNTGVRFGYMFFPREALGATPYLAAGYHRWLRDISGVGNPGGWLTNGYMETYQFTWYALGLMLQYSPAPRWVVDVDGNIGTMQNVSNKSWTPFISPPTYQKVLPLKQRFIYNFGLGADYQFAPHWHALANANYVYYRYGRSANSRLPGTAYWYEPNSTTRQTTLMVGIGYAV